MPNRHKERSSRRPEDPNWFRASFTRSVVRPSSPERDARQAVTGLDDWPVPRNLVEAAECEGRQAWLATLPATVRGLQAGWSLTVGEPFQPGGQTAWVAPVVDDTGAELVLKVAWRHPEAAHEADGL